MDPMTLGPSEWSEISKLLVNLWLAVLFVVIFATNMLLGHNIIPSLVAAGDVPHVVNRIRPLFYAVAIACFAAAVFFIVQVVGYAGVLRRIYESYWI